MILTLTNNNYDDQFIDVGNKILLYGDDEELNNYNVRPKWRDGTSAYTIRYSPIVCQYDLCNTLPISNLRNLNWKKCIDEIFWIWQKKSNNIKDLNSHIWDQWADKNGSIGSAYGYQMGKEFILNNKTFDQTDYILYGLSEGGRNRRLITNLFNHNDLNDMKLMPCVWSVTFNVTHNKLHAIVNQRSQDFIIANNWNVFQYSMLVYLLCNIYNFIPGTLTHVISDCHIYKRHIPVFNDMKNVYDNKNNTIKLKINTVKSFYDYTIDDIEIIGYNPKLNIKNIEVAI